MFDVFAVVQVAGVYEMRRDGFHADQINIDETTL